MKCQICEMKNATEYAIVYPRLITKKEEWEGVLPSGDKLISVCKDCQKSRQYFFNPVTGEIIK